MFSLKPKKMLSEMFDIDSSPVANLIKREESVDEVKSKVMICPEGDGNHFIQSARRRMERLSEEPGLDIPSIFEDFPRSKFKLMKVNILGEYWPDERRIIYYRQTGEIWPLTEIHERFHAIHHLTPDVRKHEWVDFPKTDPFYLELLAQLFTWIYIRDSHTSLRDIFLRLNENQPFIYKTYRIFEHYDQSQAEKLYWIIRNREVENPVFKALNLLAGMIQPKTIEGAVYNGIRKTINRFREQPFRYFTESDIHASLSNDIMEGNSDILIMGRTLAERSTIKTPVSLVHHEYPTNFRYDKKKLRDGYSEAEVDQTRIDGKEGDRGNYDLAVLNPEFVNRVFSEHKTDTLNSILGHIINKDITNAISRGQTEELIFAIEVKFIHLFNARNIRMLHEVQADNTKLQLAVHHKHCTRAINLVFCSSDERQRRDKVDPVIKSIRKYIEEYSHPGIINVFIESFIDADDHKNTVKPTISADRAGWSDFTNMID
jgi:hypothetical protein